MNKRTKEQYKALPKIVKIGQREYNIITSSEDRDASLSTAHAYTMLNFDTIVVNENLSAGMLRATLLHEILHAIGIVTSNREVEVPARGKEEGYGEYADRWEHFHIYQLAEPMVQLLRDNPPLVSFLTLTYKEA